MRSSALRHPPLQSLFVPVPSQKVGEPELAQKDLVLTHQAGVGK